MNILTGSKFTTRGTEAVDLSGMYLTDDLTNPTKSRIPDGVQIGAGSYLIFYADDDAEQGVLHTSFKLSKAGESIGIFDTDENNQQQIDAYTFALQRDGESAGRDPVDPTRWNAYGIPTPGRE